MATTEQLVLDTLALNDMTTYRLQSLSMPPPPKKPEWISGGDSDGAVLGRDPLHENRVIEARIRVTPQASMDLALAAVNAISDKLEEAERNIAGIDLVWTPANSTKTFTMKVLSGEVTGLPIEMTGDDAGWFLRNPSPVVNVTLTCKPYGYGSEVTGSPSSSTTPLVTIELTGVTGDVPAEGRLIITDNATKDRRHVEWGLESRYYPTSSPPGLILDSDSLVTSGFSGTGTTRSGAYDPGAAGNSVIRANLGFQPVAVCGTGDQSHVGFFRVKARVYAVSSAESNIHVRLSWLDGDGPLRANPYTTPAVVNGFAEVDLGVIAITEKTLGTQRWTGRVEAFTDTVGVGDTIDIDYLMLIPAGEGYGKVRADYVFQTGVVVARDEFTSTTAGNTLNARVAPVGGTWATSGVATDFVFADGPDTTGESITRSTNTEASPRFAILGSTNYTDVQTEVYRRRSIGLGTTGTFVDSAAIARWTDSSNYARFRMRTEVGSVAPWGFTTLYLELVVAGSVTVLRQLLLPSFDDFNVWYGLRLMCFASGTITGQYLGANGVVSRQLQASSTVIATGGTLATGKPGLYDHSGNSAAANRYYDWFSVSTPPAEPISVYSGRAIEIRSDSALRQDSTGTFYGNPPGYVGSRFYVPPAGTRSRKVRIAAKAKRNDVDVAVDDQIADSLTVQANYTPRYLVVPH